MSQEPTYPLLLQPVLDCVDIRAVAEFYRQLFGFVYREGDEPPSDGPDTADWLVLRRPTGERGLAFQKVEDLPPTTWPDPGIPQQMHLDTWVPDRQELDRQHERALALGAVLRLDRSDDDVEPLRVYADPAGHLFCMFTWVEAKP